MSRYLLSLSPALFFTLLACSFSAGARAEEKNSGKEIPDDVRYMLIDMYGVNQQDWPAAIFKWDLNLDGNTDWIVQSEKCEECAAQIFLCIPDAKGGCSEYCYKDVSSLKNLEHNLSLLKCESTC